MTGPLCGAVTPSPEDTADCLCLLDEHDTETDHQCGCGRQWTSKPLKTARRTA